MRAAWEHSHPPYHSPTWLLTLSGAFAAQSGWTQKLASAAQSSPQSPGQRWPHPSRRRSQRRLQGVLFGGCREGEEGQEGRASREQLLERPSPHSPFHPRSSTGERAHLSQGAPQGAPHGTGL